MESCLLCLEINKDILDAIKVNSTEWQELKISETITKHFWSLHTIQPTGWICLSCWKEVDSFHKFFLRIEEAHLNIATIKVEDYAVSLDCGKDSLTQNSNVKNCDVELPFCALEPEILINQNDNGVSAESDFKIDELDLDNAPLEQAYQQLRLKSEIINKDPIEKQKCTKKKTTYKKKLKLGKNKQSMEAGAEVKEEPIDINSNDSNSETDSSIDASDISCPSAKESKEPKTYSRQFEIRRKNDEFIVEHFKQMVCDLCQAPFKDFPEMKEHFTSTHKQRGYVVCCKKKFFDRTRLVDHLHCHLNPEHFKCKECGKIMSERKTYANHMLHLHRPNEVVKKHSCDVCGKCFAKAHVLRTHKLIHLEEAEKKFHCSDCGKNYGSPYILKQHIEAVHLKRFAKICYICGKAINSSAEFKVHMNKHEGIPIPISCDICGLRLTTERGLKLHKKFQHPVGRKQEYHCTICPKISPTPKALRKHINTMHENTYNHTCNICEKAFKRMESLREHIATHTGKALYTCAWCPKTFNSKSNMHTHWKKLHPKEWEESKLQKYSGNIPPDI